MAKPPCGPCKAIWHRRGGEPPCYECIPALYPENIEAVNVYLLVSDQVTWAGALDVLAVIEVIRLYKIADDRRVFEKVMFLGRHFAKKREGERALKGK